VLRNWRQSLVMVSLVTVVVTTAGLYGVAQTVATTETLFQVENRAAMNKMMADMEVSPSGNVDQDFAATMIPHHQGAIEMAHAELRYGHNEQLRRIAQEIIVDQQQEIVAMRLALNQPLPPLVAAPDQPPNVPASDPATICKMRP
jgi:hypothetical protein